MIITAWYVKPKKRVPVLDGKWWVSVILDYMRRYPNMVMAAAPTKLSMGAVAAATFGPGGPGFALMQLLLLAIVAYMVSWIASAVGHGQFASMAKVTALLSGFAIVCGAILNALEKIWQIIG